MPIPTVKQMRNGLNTARFRGVQKEFATARDAYVWLVESIIGFCPSIFADHSTAPLRSSLGKSGKYFAKTLEELFHSSPHLSREESAFVRLSNGWVASVTLSNAQKFDILLRLSVVAGLTYPSDWEWNVPGATALLVDKQLKAATTKDRR